MIEEVRVRESMPVTTITGMLTSTDKSDVSLTYDALVEDVPVSVGSYVNQGDVLLKLSEEQISKELAEVRLKQKEAEATIEKNTNLLRGREKLLEEGKIEPEEVTRLEKQISKDEADALHLKEIVSKLNYNMEHLTLTSPISGVVNVKNASAGTVATAGAMLFSVVNTDPIIFSFVVGPVKPEEMQLNSQINVAVRDRPDVKYSGKITYISPEMDPAKKGFDVWATIPNPDKSLKIGTNASTEIKRGETDKIYIVPASAVLSISSRPVIYKVVKGVARKTPVTISAQEGGEIEVVKGLEQGDMVVVKGGESLYDGASVNIFER